MSHQAIFQNYYDMLDSLLDINLSNESELLESLKLSYKIRHNICHHLIAFTLTEDFSLFKEQRIDQTFMRITDFPSNIARLTPDMVVFFSIFDDPCGYNVRYEMLKKVVIADISVSRISNLSFENKRDKYEKIKTHLKNYDDFENVEILLHPITFLPDMSNAEKVTYDFFKIFEMDECLKNFPYADLRLFLNSLTSVQSRLKQNINNETLVNSFFRQEFGTEDNNVDVAYDDIISDRLPRLNDFYLNNAKMRNSSTAEMLKECYNDISTPEWSDEHEESLFCKYAEIYNEMLNDEEVLKTFIEKETVAEKVFDVSKELDLQAKTFSSKKIKPSHHIFTPIDEKILQTGDKNIDEPSIFSSKEQNQILRMLRLVCKYERFNDDRSSFLNDLKKSFETIISSDSFIAQKSIFDNNVWINKEFNEKLHKEYHEYREECLKNKTPVESLLNFNRRFKMDRGFSKLPGESEIRAYKQKMLKIPHNFLDPKSVAWWEKGHSGKKEPKKVDATRDEYSCNFDHSEYVDKLLEMFTEKLSNGTAEDARRGYKLDSSDENKHTLFYNFCMANNDLDNNALNFLKDEMRKTFKPVLKLLETTVGYSYLYNQYLVAEQLMHYTQFSIPSNTYSFFTTGMHNLLCIVNNSYHDAGKDVGKAFMFVGYFDDENWDNPFFGRMQTTKVTIGSQRKILFCTNWRRLETFKLTFLKDQFCSVMATSMNALLRYKGILVGFSHMYSKEDYCFDIVKHHFSLKVLISLTSNQRIAEMLADMRYAIMASFSDFSEIEKLVLDKFSPKYATVMEAWIASRITNLGKQIENFKDKENIRTFFKQPVFVRGKRRDDSIGGKFELPSIWTGIIITELQDLLDDMFIYVHTLKEPSNIHHENVKAVQTILEYQNKYEKLSKERKQGKFNDSSGIKEFLIDNNPIGHISELVRLSSRRTMATLKGFDLNIRTKQHFFERVANITSTKAAIPEYEREIIDLPEKSKRRLKKKQRKEKFKDIANTQLTQERENFMIDYGRLHKVKVSTQVPRNVVTDVAKESFLPGNNRSKVHDCLLDVLENNIDLSTVFDVGEWNIKSNNARVVSDICIKAQYGAKREFYVINVGAKCNARILENIFSEICKSLPNEMISVPGDKKMLIMQDFINDALTKKGSDQQVVFVNGDCTKWSAAETMECFMSLIMGLKGFLNSEVLKYLLCTVNMWSNKSITIPTSILNNTFFTIDNKTEYLKIKSPIIKSDQNFLQGMFNYMSSFKAVCSSNITREIWKKIYPDSKLQCEHLEHSDDYSLIITSNDLKEVKLFRALHRMIMRSHGFNDSIKKTNTQRFLMEFISLVSLNGHMTYPHIKKLKECGMNLGCTGFRDDIDGAMSRVGEAVRVGSILCSAYFMQRSHLFNVARSYSILPNQRNCMVFNMEDLFRLPVEVFGLPDTHPILSFLTKGLANNYRLLNYQHNDRDFVNIRSDNLANCTVKLNHIFKGLLDISIENDKSRNVCNTEDFINGSRLYHPGYSFDVENKLIKKIRNKVKMDVEEATNFWENHLSYNFIKPQNRKLLVPWMRAMYFKHNFSLAYSRNSRSQITLRLSTFTSKQCLYYFPEDIINLDVSNQFSIKDYIDDFMAFCTGDKSCDKDTNKFVERCKDSNLNMTEAEYKRRLSLISLNCDASISTIYSLLDNSRAIYDKPHSRSTVATLTPTKVNWMTLDNKPDAIIQYIFNYEDFLCDNRKNKGLPSLEADKKKLAALYPDIDDSSKHTVDMIKSVYTDIILSQNKRNLCMTYSSAIQNLEEFIRTHIEFGSVFGIKYSLFTSGATESMNPHTGELYYKRLYTYTRNEYRLLIEDSALVFSLLKHGYKIDDDTIKKCLLNMRVKSTFDADQRLTITSSELWDEKSVTDLQIMGCSNNELKIFGFIKSFIKNDVQDIMDLINKDFSYSYIYFKPEQWLSPLVKEAVEFSYMNCLFNAYRLINDDILLLTNSRKKFLLADAHLIAQKLFNNIKLYELERKFGITSLRDVQESLTFRKKPNDTKELLKLHWKLVKRLFLARKVSAVFKYNLDSRSTMFKYLDQAGHEVFDYTDQEDFFKLIDFSDTFKFMFTETLYETKGLNQDFINKKVTIDYQTLSVYNGKRKLFGLPLLSCYQSNTTEVINDMNLNGLTLNWWLKDSRIRSLLHRDEISIGNMEYNNMLDFYIKDNRWILHAETVKALTQLEKMPTTLFRQCPEKLFETIESRIIKNDQTGIKSMDAATFLTNVVFKERTPTPEPVPKKKKEKIKYSREEALMLGFGLTDSEDDEESDHESSEPSPIGRVENPDDDFDFGEVDDLLGDLDNVKFTQREEDSDNDVDDEIDRILEVERDSNESSKDSLINFADFQFLQPTFIKDETLILGKTRTTTILEEIGDPTRFLIEKMYGTNLQIDHLSVKEKIGLIYKLNKILICAFVLTDIELYLTLVLLSKLILNLHKSEEWKVADDFVCVIDEDNKFDFFLKYVGTLSNDQETLIKDKGGKIKFQRINRGFGSLSRGSIRAELIEKAPKEELEKYYLIPVKEERAIQLLESCSSVFTIQQFLGVQILFDCYERLFHEPFVRAGFVLEILKELQD